MTLLKVTFGLLPLLLLFPDSLLGKPDQDELTQATGSFSSGPGKSFYSVLTVSGQQVLPTTHHQIMDPKTMAMLGDLLDQKIGNIDKKIDNLETKIVDKVTASVVDKVNEAITKTVSDQIESHVAPLAQRQEEYEIKTGDKVNKLEKQLSDLSDLVKKHANASEQHVSAVEYPPLPLVQAAPSSSSQHNISRAATNPAPNDLDDASNDLITNIVRRAKCVVGLAPITPLHVEQIGAENGDAGLKGAVIEYLRKELNIRESEISETDIDSVFLPVKSTNDNFTKVYVRFTSIKPANLCLNLAKGLKNRDNKVSRYFPKPLNARLGAISHVAYQLRNQDPPYKTSLEYSEDDIILMVCPHGHYSYRQYPLQNLPPVDLTHVRSPPVGRKSKRLRSPSVSPVKDNKKDRKDSPSLPPRDRDIDISEDIEKEKECTDDVADDEASSEEKQDNPSPLPPLRVQPDIGQISNLQAMSPTTGHLTFDYTRRPDRRLSLNY